MSRSIPNSANRNVLILSAAVFLFVTSCGDHTKVSQESSDGTTTVAKDADLASLPARGKMRLAVPPAKAVFGMIYINTTNNREYIFDGAGWVPHDRSVETFYSAKPSQRVPHCCRSMPARMAIHPARPPVHMADLQPCPPATPPSIAGSVTKLAAD